MQNAAVFGRVVSGELPVSAIGAAAGLRSLRFARESAAARRAGSVTSQGDASMHADIARSSFGVDGAGVKVGVLSDSFNCLGGAGGDVASGDLSTVQPILEISSCNGATDEGRAMLQIVHDVAPGASLAFASAFNGEAAFANNIVALKNAGAKVIVDDVFYYDEPMFQDGIVAQAVDTVVAGGAAYFSAAGNEARQSYQKTFKPGGTLTNGQFPSALGAPHFFGGVPHNFASNGTDLFQSITIPPHTTIIFSVQWDSPFASAGPGPGSPNDLDVYVFNSAATQVIGGAANDNIGGDAVEFLSFGNNGNSPLNVNLMIVSYSPNPQSPLPNPGLIKYVYFPDSSAPVTIEYDTQSSTIYGHSNANGAEAVGAAWYKETTQFGVTPPLLEPYSSAGGTPVLFSTSGNPINDPRAGKPEITAPDGGNTTFFFSDSASDPDTFPNFFGTSAAAPHAGGVAALLLQANPTLTPANVYAALENSAIDMGTAGFDNDSGFGLVQADAALGFVATGLDLALTGSDAPDPVIVGNNVTYTLTVTNRGFIDATGVTVTDILPASFNLISATPSQGSGCSGTTTITCNLGGILNQGTATVTIVAATTSIGQAANSASVAANESDFNSGNNTVNQATTVSPPPLVIGANSLPNGESGISYSANLQISGGAAPYTATVFAGALPLGLSLNSSTGVISGTPTKANNKKPPSFTVRVTDSLGGSVTKQFSIVVYPALVNKTKSLKKASVGKAYAVTLKAAGGKLPYTWSIVGGSLPAGLAASPSGAISGMPGAPAPATYPLTFRVTDALGNFDDVPLSLVIQ
ncbi:MAG TPA: putative Ig domain-containing protein [Candidatus Binatia bacterium]